jgi:hypothetical protein
MKMENETIRNNVSETPFTLLPITLIHAGCPRLVNVNRNDFWLCQTLGSTGSIGSIGSKYFLFLITTVIFEIGCGDWIS